MPHAEVYTRQTALYHAVHVFFLQMAFYDSERLDSKLISRDIYQVDWRLSGRL